VGGCGGRWVEDFEVRFSMQSGRYAFGWGNVYFCGNNLAASNSGSMRIQKLIVKNFRCFENLELYLHRNLNVFIGVNGSGKTALLEAIKLGVIGAIGEIKGAMPTKSADAGYAFHTKKDPRVRTYARGEWTQSDFVSIETTGTVGSDSDKLFTWARLMKKANVKFSHSNRFDDIKLYFSYLNSAIQTNEDISLPLFAYYSTGRLFLENNDTGLEMNGERVKGYLNAPTAKSSQYLFKKWFEKRERNQEKYRVRNIDFDFSPFESVKRIIVQTIPGCTDIFYDDLRFKDIALLFKDGQMLPYSMLSDGTRNLVALFSDLALRCAVLNPWMGEKINEVSGVVLIDEVDLHLHPSWQRQVVPSLLKAFPNIQFFITTHSPMTLASLEPYICDPEPNVFVLNRNGVEIEVNPLTREILGTANHWLTDALGLEEPRSLEAESAIRLAKKLLEEKKPDTQAVRQASESLMKHIQAHDTFWIRWNYFAQKHGVEL
jgi:predicted ATP-binding protein involved in virulence